MQNTKGETQSHQERKRKMGKKNRNNQNSRKETFTISCSIDHGESISLRFPIALKEDFLRCSYTEEMQPVADLFKVYSESPAEIQKAFKQLLGVKNNVRRFEQLTMMLLVLRESLDCD